MEAESQFNGRAIMIYFVACILTGILAEVVWEAAGTAAGGPAAVASPQVKPQASYILKMKGIDPESKPLEAKKLEGMLPPQEKSQLQSIVGSAMTGVNWFVLTLLVSALVYGLVGFAAGYLTRTWALAGAVPVLSLLGANPIIRFQMAYDLSGGQKIIIFLVAQLILCYILAFVGATWSSRRLERRLDEEFMEE